MTSQFTREPVSDQVVRERVKTVAGRMLANPGSLDVAVSNGRVTLSGPILGWEAAPLIDTVRSTSGVREIVNHLEIHQTADNVPGLQGRRPSVGRLATFQGRWTPVSRLLGSLAGGALVYNGYRRHSGLGRLELLAGAGLLTRSMTNLNFNRLTGIRAGRNAIDVENSINIDVPPTETYAFFRDLTNLPRFMDHVDEVKDLGGGRYHWVVQGPAGIPVHFDAVITKDIPSQEIAWKSVDSAIQSAGKVLFQRNPDGTTHMDVRMSYNPVAGALGHAVVSLFGNNPHQAMNEDLMTFKSLLETGKTTAHHETVTKQEVVPPTGVNYPSGPGYDVHVGDGA